MIEFEFKEVERIIEHQRVLIDHNVLEHFVTLWTCCEAEKMLSEVIHALQVSCFSVVKGECD